MRSQEHNSTSTMINISVSRLFVLDVFREQSPFSKLFPDTGLFGVIVLFVECNTSITISHKSRASNPSICSPASSEMNSDSVKLWDTDV